MFGRSSEAEVKITDNSISRFHAFLKVTQNRGNTEIWIEDIGSKFGTLKLNSDVIQMNKKNSMLTLQIGRVLCTFIYRRVVPKWCCLTTKPRNLYLAGHADLKYFTSQTLNAIQNIYYQYSQGHRYSQTGDIQNQLQGNDTNMELFYPNYSKKKTAKNLNETDKQLVNLESKWQKDINFYKLFVGLEDIMADKRPKSK